VIEQELDNQNKMGEYCLQLPVASRVSPFVCVPIVSWQLIPREHCKSKQDLEGAKPPLPLICSLIELVRNFSTFDAETPAGAVAIDLWPSKLPVEEKKAIRVTLQSTAFFNPKF
jgi:hypothetical protein